MNLAGGFSFVNQNNSAILLFHGLTGSPFEIHQYGKMLSKAGYDVFCPILPGHCKGIEELKNSTWQEWQSFALEAYDELKLKYDKVFISGLCLGAVLGFAVAQERQDVAGIVGLSTTLFLDGWDMPWYKFLMPIGFLSVYKLFYLFPETECNGVKNQVVRNKIMHMQSSNSQALSCYPFICIEELFKYSKYVRRHMRKVNAPVLLIHSKFDNITSVKSAEFVFNKISSPQKQLLLVEDSYHVVTLDNDKKYVTDKTLEFLEQLKQFDKSDMQLVGV